MTRAAHDGSTIRSGFTAVTAMLATVGAIEATMRIGWPAPLPSAWSLLAIALVAQVRGIPAGFWAAAIGLGYAAYSAGFTSGQLSGLEVWGRAGARVVSFGLVAISLVVLAGRTGPFARGASTADVAASGRPASSHGEDGRPAVFAGEAIELEALRRVASRSAHDLNNMLTVILASCELAEAAPDGTAGEAPLPAIADAAAACALITDRLLAACRPASA